MSTAIVCSHTWLSEGPSVSRCSLCGARSGTTGTTSPWTLAATKFYFVTEAVAADREADALALGWATGMEEAACQLDRAAMLARKRGYPITARHCEANAIYLRHLLTRAEG